MGRRRAIQHRGSAPTVYRYRPGRHALRSQTRSIRASTSAQPAISLGRLPAVSAKPTISRSWAISACPQPSAARPPRRTRFRKGVGRRVIPCLDVREGEGVKSVRFRDHQIAGDILELARCFAGTPTELVCHTGATACFASSGPESSPFAFLRTLGRTVESRLREKVKNSYTGNLVASGMRRMAQKVAEE